jgi:hypothetical protein
MALRNPTDTVDQRRVNIGEGKYLNQDQQMGYSIGTLEFPDGLRQKPDMQHYVAFYINVRDKSRKGKTKNFNDDFFVSEQEQRRIDSIRKSSFEQDDIAAGGEFLRNNAGMVLGAITAGGLTGAMLGKNSNLKDLAKSALLGSAAGLATGLVVDHIVDKLSKSPSFTSGKTSRLKEVITLHVSEKPAVKYGVNYTNKDMGLLTGLLVQGTAGGSLKNAILDNPEVQARLLTELTKIPSLKQGGGVISDMIELNTKQKVNPFREVMFESVDYRTFQFSYRFFPKNDSETTKIQKIIKTFKKHMLPELTSDKMFYVYPSEFDIQYFYKDSPNPYLHKFARCALTDISVEYGGEQFVTFEDGSPVEIGMTLTFQELEQMTSEGVERYGY